MHTAILAGMMSLTVPVGGAFASEAPAPQTSLVSLDTRNITLGDIASTNGTAADPAWVLSRIQDGRSEILLSTERRAQLDRRRLPGLALPLLHEGPVRFRFDPEVSPEKLPDEGICYVLNRPAARGTFLSGADLVEGSCAYGDMLPAVAFDHAAGALRSADDLPAGTPFGRMRLPEMEIVQPGVQMQLVVREGPVTVSREVETLQPGLPGRRVFVRTIDGDTFSAPLLPLGEGE
jgi:hypothetical protein